MFNVPLLQVSGSGITIMMSSRGPSQVNETVINQFPSLTKRLTLLLFTLRLQDTISKIDRHPETETERWRLKTNETLRRETE
jgi:hypothetical protein